ncbi:MAG TPA: hypothetical protein VJ600_05945 [Holophagaceae bacterium]|nr:hypothetical protein [Holophagaceae bacterium]
MFPLRSALLLGVLSFSLLGQDYAIDLSRLKAGEKVRGLVATATEETRMTVMATGQPMHTESGKSVVKLKADVEEIGKDPAGRSRLKLSILDLDGTVDGRKAELGSLGATVMADYQGDKTVFTGADGKSLPEEAQKLLRMVVSIDRDPDSDDRAFGTKERKRVGDVWDINRSWAASQLRETGVQVDPGNISGSVQLKELVKDQGIDCLRIAVTMDLREIKGIPMPPGLSLTKSVVNCTLSGLYPLDPTKGRQRSTEGYDMDFLAYGKVPTDNGPVEMSLQMRMTRTNEAVWTSPMAARR